MSTVGVWFVGAKGGVATTAICGTLAMRQGLADRIGMITESDFANGVPLVSLDDLVFGGHDIRAGSLVDHAHEIRRATGTLRHEVIEAIAPELDATSKRLRPGVLFESGATIESLTDRADECRVDTATEAVERIRGDLEEFRQEHQLDAVVVVNLASTETTATPSPALDTADGVLGLIRDNARTHLRASTLYAVAAAQAQCAYLNFTPSPGALNPGLAELFTREGQPFMGSDGKTGETLLKSVLAPMFFQRQLRVRAWHGYNMLGDRDGQVLADAEHKASKIESKDHLIQSQLGPDVDTHVAIDFVPSLDDWKTAWDFIHFQGFLGVKMSLQFTWQGCDSILAAPLVIDMVRLLAHAQSHGPAGPQPHLAQYFKSPYGVDHPDFPTQFKLLTDYLATQRKPK